MADDGDDLSAIGFLFGGAAAKAEATFHVGGGDGMDITVMAITDEDPGSVQSGQYVWPAAPVLADYAWGQLQQGKLPTAGVCVELGAGCGLCGISVACCPASGFEEVIFTDHDPGTLHQVTENAEAQGDKRRIATRAEPLEWGEAATALPKASLVRRGRTCLDPRTQPQALPEARSRSRSRSRRADVAKPKHTHALQGAWERRDL